MLLAMLAGLLPLTVFAVQAGPLVVWNATASTPVTCGACAVGREPEAPPRRRLRAVLARPAQPQLFARRVYLPRGMHC